MTHPPSDHHVAYLSRITGLPPYEIHEVLGGEAFRHRVHRARHEETMRCRDAERAAIRVAKQARALRDAIAAYDQVDFGPWRSEAPRLTSLDELISFAEWQVGFYQRAQNVREGERAWASVVIAAGVARVFTRASMSLTIGEREGTNGREPSTVYCWAVMHVLAHFHVHADFRRAAERGAQLRDDA